MFYSTYSKVKGIINVKQKMKRQRNRLKRGERNNTCPTHICRLLQSLESLEKIDKKLELSANTVAFSSYK